MSSRDNRTKRKKGKDQKEILGVNWYELSQMTEEKEKREMRNTVTSNG